MDDGNEWNDPSLFDQPPEVLGIAVSRIRSYPVWSDAEAHLRAIKHGAGSTHLSLPDCPCRLNIHDDRALGVDQVVGRIGKIGAAFFGPRPSGCRIRFGYKLWLNRRGRSECGIIECFQIFARARFPAPRATSGLQSSAAIDRTLLALECPH